MLKKITALLLALVLIFTLTGCREAVGEAVGNVADAAKRELEILMQKILEKYKITPIEIKSAVGKLNDASDSDAQFFCAALIQSNSNLLPKGCAMALGALFEDGGVGPQTAPQVENPYLVHKTVTFDHTDFENADYYVLWVYTPSFKEMLPDMEGIKDMVGLDDLSGLADMAGLGDLSGIADMDQFSDISGMIDMDSITSFGGIG